MAATLEKRPEALLREERAASALRENLRKRKEQEQKRKAKKGNEGKGVTNAKGQ